MCSQSLAASQHIKRVGLIAGQGDLPELIASALEAQSIELTILAINNNTRPDWLSDHDHQWIEMAEIARTIELFQEKSVSHIVMAGKLPRPPIKALKPPALAARILKRLGAALFKGDDAMFKAIVSIFEEDGFSILGADEILRELLTPEGVLTKRAPSQQEITACKRAMQAAFEIGKHDKGQAAIATENNVIATEGEAGTDALIIEASKLHDTTQCGVLAKVKKPHQERRVDLPSIGIHTINTLAQHKFHGIALQAGHSLILKQEEVVAAANEAGIFIIGLPLENSDS